MYMRMNREEVEVPRISAIEAAVDMGFSSPSYVEIGDTAHDGIKPCPVSGRY
jgi:hypothetical protein